MTRRLPWKREQGDAAPELSASPRRPGPLATLPPPAPPRARGSPGLREPLRSPSTSPPPEPPAEQPMVPGDDRYRMVEDEFLHTAQRFTTHLHRAEYDRLKARAKARHALTIRDIERPVVGPATPTARLRNAVSKRASLQRRLLTTPRRARQAADGGRDDDDDDDDDNEAPWVGTSLQSLMETPGIEARPISSYAPNPLPIARATPGPRQPPPPPRWRSLPVQEAEQTPFHADALSRVDNTQKCVLRDRTRDSGRDRSSGPKLEERAAGGSDGNATNDEDDPFSIKRRRTRRERSRAQLRNNDDTRPPKDLLPDTIPSFL